jgi:Ca-activated chloride channel homolog
MSYLLLLRLLAQGQPTFRSDIALVHVDVEVREDGHVIADLGRENFRVADEGKPRTIVSFGREEEPLDVVLVFDARREMRPDVRRIAEAAHTVLSDLRPGDHIAAIAFGATAGDCGTELILDFTGDFEAAERSIGKQAAQPETGPKSSGFCSIQRGLASAAQHLQGQPNGNRRRAIIIITDDKGVPTRPAVVRDVRHDLWRADAVVLGVIVHSGEVVASIGPPYRGARYAADQTGGDILKTDDAAEGLREMMHRLRTRYSLYYALPPGRSGEERKIRVQLAPDAAKRYPRAVVRARTGYAVPG